MDRARNEHKALSGPLDPARKKSEGGRKLTRFNTMQNTVINDDSHFAKKTMIIDQQSSSKIQEAATALASNGENWATIRLDAGSNPCDHVNNPEPGKRSPFRSLLATNLSFKQVSQELRKLALWPKSSQEGAEKLKTVAVRAFKGLIFINKNTDAITGWPAVEKRFDESALDGSLPRSLFGHCIGMKESKEFAGALFDALARRSHISPCCITKDQLKMFWDQIADQSFDSRLRTFFDMVDKNADGWITEDEIKEIISLSASANKLSGIHEQAEEYARLIMEELDPDHLGHVEINNLETLLLQAPSISVARGKSKDLSMMLSTKLKQTKEPNPLRRWYQNANNILQDNWQRVWIIALWLSICSGLFAWKFFQFRHRAVFNVMGYCVCTAKGAAETLKFNMALILLPVCRNTITWLRNTKLGSIVPFDDNLNFHKVISVGITIGTIFHAGPLIACNYPRHVQKSNFWWFFKNIVGNSGIMMTVLMTIAFTLASPWFRRGRLSLPNPLKKLTGFNAFWYSHHLFIIVYVLHIIHGVSVHMSKIWLKKTTWMYVAIPVVIYAYERLVRAFRYSVRPVKIKKVALYPGNVMSLHVSRPQGFRYHSGQYIFVNCAAVSPFEWHPFSITSAPQDDYISIHIRTLGDWTHQLKTVFSEVCLPTINPKRKLISTDEEAERPSINPLFPKVLIDGPYGAPAQDYKKYEVVLLVGLGIGATPFISLLKDILNNLKLLDAECVADGQPDLESGESDTRSTSISRQSSKRGSIGSSFKTRRAYFYWMTREQGSFEWFKGVMNEVAESDMGGAIEMHNHCTSVYEEGDVRSALIAMLQSLHHAKNGVDVVSGTRVKSHFGRPNWRSVYKRIALNHPDQRIGVFYCGAATLTKELRGLALHFSRKTTTKFDFHKENF